MRLQLRSPRRSALPVLYFCPTLALWRSLNRYAETPEIIVKEIRMHVPDSIRVSMRKVFLALLMVWLMPLSASMMLVSPAHAEDGFLEPEQAFRFAAHMADARTLEVSYVIADGYYMYRERFHFVADHNAKLGEPVFPDGIVKFDDTFQKKVETYRHEVTIRIPVAADAAFRLTATSQGCTDKGLCYSPMESVVQLSPDSAAGPSAMRAEVVGAAAGGDAALSDNNDADRIQTSLKNGKLLAILPLFFLLGLGLSLTPCVLPMVPILSSIIVGEGVRTTRARGLLLSAVYALGMALVYTVLGVAAGLIGEGLAAALQNPWVLSAFALLLTGLSLSMFGFYELQIPGAWQTRLSQLTGNDAGGKLVGVFAMGAVSALIVGPCVAAPLAGALLYISQSRDVIVGGSALFAMAVGMSVPLLLVGVSAGTLLPRAGAWMEGVKRFFGMLMLATALWTVMPVLPGAASVLAWAVLGIGYGAYLLWGQAGAWVAKAVGMVALILGGLQLVNVSTGGRDALAPFAQFGGMKQAGIDFRHVASEAELDSAIAQAAGKPVLLDFYADWCVSCVEMEKLTFSDPRVHAALGRFVLLKADVTANNANDKALLKRFKLFGPPGIVFFDAQGKKMADRSLIGYESAEQFLQRLDKAAPT
jgi:thiol:disulfide interchange protein DsbD